METRSTTFAVNFHFRKDRVQEENLPVYARIAIMAKRRELAMKQKISAEDWNEEMAKTKREEFKVLNNYLEQRRSSFVECYRDMVIRKKVINIDTFRKAYGEDENGLP
jgi:hypothetical protein